jgi:hypothetical protein
MLNTSSWFTRYSVQPSQAKSNCWHGRPRAMYLVVTFLMRNDNQGNRRLFRTVKDFATLKQATKWYTARVETSKYLRAELLKASDLTVVAEHGNGAAEDAWIDTNLAR